MLNPSDEIKSKLDMVEVIREYLPLKAAGINFRALCPFHREKTPSLIVSPERRIWHCFGCGKGGDIFTFVMEIEGWNFAEALRMLAKKAGVVLRRADPALASQRNRLMDLVDLASRYYHRFLLDKPEAAWARNYLETRGLTQETIQSWQIGCSPDSWDKLVNFLTSRGFSENEIFLAGLSVKKERTPGFYDRFRDRIMFPIRDLTGNIVAFSARVNPAKEADEKLGKYINSPQTMIYNKSATVFGLDKAKMAIKGQEAVVLVEGQMDVLTAHQYGFSNVVASSGTSLTADQVNLLKRYSTNLILAFDMDKAGDLAAERGITQAWQAEMNIKVMELPSGKDPDEFIRQNPSLWPEQVAQAKLMMQYLFDKTFSRLNLESYEDKRQAVKILLPQFLRIGSKIEEDYWLKKLSQITDFSENILREELTRLTKKTQVKGAAGKTEPAAVEIELATELTRQQMLSELLLAIILKYPAYLDYAANYLFPHQLTDQVNQFIYRNLIVYYNKAIDSFAATTAVGQEITPATGQEALTDLAVAAGQEESTGPEAEINFQAFSDWLKQSLEQPAGSQDNQLTDSSCASRLNKLALLADKEFFDWSLEQIKAELINIITVLKKNYLSQRLKEITKLIAQIEQAGPAEVQADQENQLQALLEEFKTLTEEIRELDKV